MRKFPLIALTFATLTLPAKASDMLPYYRTPVGVPITWTGLYIGASVGWIDSFQGDVDNAGSDTGPGGLGSALAIGAIPDKVGINKNGFIGGAQLGYNWQVEGNWILGVEADFNGVSAKNGVVAAFPGNTTFLPVTTTYNSEIDSLGTVRARVGLLLSASVLWYATGGLAYGQTKFSTSATCPAFAPPCSTEGGTASSSSRTAMGWAFGGGVEWRFAPAWSLKAEYLYIDLGNQTNTLSYSYGANTSSLTSTFDENDNIFRVGINYKMF